jgi:hypothetical protein
MLFDKLNQYVEQESDKLVHIVVRLRWDTETDIQLVRKTLKIWPLTWMISLIGT